MYKIGDKVKIKKREGNDFDYKFFFSDLMLPFTGRVLEINSIQEKAHWPKEYKYPDDGNKYCLTNPNTGEDTSYSWASSMFELYVEDSDTRQSGTSLPSEDKSFKMKYHKDTYKLNFIN